jgi:uncharacterized protein
MRALALLLAAPLLFAAAPFAQQEQQWRAAYEKSLKAPDGWLSVAGLFWLHEGANSAGSDPRAEVRLPAGAPPHAGVFRLDKRNVTWVAANGSRTAIEPDTSDHPTIIRVGDLLLTAIRRADRTGIRLRDPNAATRRDFRGSSWFPPDPAWRVTAKWVALAKPKKIPITNILGMTDEEDCPGYAEWTRGGKVFRLEPVVEDNLLFFMFRDTTNAHTTYGAGRFLYADAPKGGKVILDFNQAQNPPCAFTAYATCPLPPPQNRIAVAVTAGEKIYGSHPK